MKKQKNRVTGYGQSYVVRVPDDLLDEFLKAAALEGFKGAELVRGWMHAYVLDCYAKRNL